MSLQVAAQHQITRGLPMEVPLLYVRSALLHSEALDCARGKTRVKGGGESERRIWRGSRHDQSQARKCPNVGGRGGAVRDRAQVRVRAHTRQSLKVCEPTSQVCPSRRPCIWLLLSTRLAIAPAPSQMSRTQARHRGPDTAHPADSAKTNWTAPR